MEKKEGIGFRMEKKKRWNTNGLWNLEMPKSTISLIYTVFK